MKIFELKLSFSEFLSKVKVSVFITIFSKYIFTFPFAEKKFVLLLNANLSASIENLEPLFPFLSGKRL